MIAAAYFDRLLPSLAVQAEVVDRVERAVGRVLAVDVGRVANSSAAQWLVEVWTASVGFEGNAPAAVGYALRCAPTGDLQRAAWTARQAVEALELYAEQAPPMYPSLRRELARQDRTITELAVVDHPPSDVLERIRQDATGVAEDFWGGA